MAQQRIPLITPLDPTQSSTIFFRIKNGNYNCAFSNYTISYSRKKQ